jgi:hypothetical protein
MVAATAKGSAIVDLYNCKTGNWSTSTLSLARWGLAGASVQWTVAFAGGMCEKCVCVYIHVCVIDGLAVLIIVVV